MENRFLSMPKYREIHIVVSAGIYLIVCINFKQRVLVLYRQKIVFLQYLLKWRSSCQYLCEQIVLKIENCPVFTQIAQKGYFYGKNVDDKPILSWLVRFDTNLIKQDQFYKVTSGFHDTWILSYKKKCVFIYHSLMVSFHARVNFKYSCQVSISLNHYF